MRILLDECMDERFRKSFPTHDCQTVKYAGFAGRKNGALLSAAEVAKFDVLLTVDRGFEYEQSLAGRKIAILIVSAESNRLRDLLPLVPDILVALESLQPGQVLRIGE
jgi:hypothetical protein